jgi:hypothetical protein
LCYACCFVNLWVASLSRPGQKCRWLWFHAEENKVGEAMQFAEVLLKKLRSTEMKTARIELVAGMSIIDPLNSANQIEMAVPA